MSTSDQYWALPDGISEALPNEAAHLEALRRQLLDLYATWGYQMVIPPLVEYMQSLTTGAGSSLDVQTFKVTDQLNGRMMGIRADMTPQVARIDAHKLKHDHPQRLCYIGSVLRTRAFREGGSRSPLQVGAELFGHAGLASDCEVISLLMTTLEHCQLRDVTLDIGHVGIFRALAKQAGLDPQQEATFFGMLERKSLPEIDTWLAHAGLAPELTEMLRQLPRLHGTADVLTTAREVLAGGNPAIRDALDYLQALVTRLQPQFPDCTLRIDLTELSGYDYHTGIVYAVYVPDVGYEIARGGRYDGAGKLFGRARPATGFSTDLRLLSRYVTPDSHKPVRILAPVTDTTDAALEQLIQQLRARGQCVICQLDKDHLLTPEQADCQQAIIQNNGQWVVADV